MNRHDVYRKESFPEVFPEFWEHIKAYQPDNLKMGEYDPFDPWKKIEEKYDAAIDYAEVFSSALSAFLKKAHPAQDENLLKQNFFSRTAKLEQVVKSKNLLFYLLGRTRVEEIYTKVMDDQFAPMLEPNLKQTFAFYLMENDTPYNPDITYADFIGIALARGLQKTNTAANANKLSRQFLDRVREKFKRYDSAEGENLAFYALLYSDLHELYADVMRDDDAPFFARLRQCLSTYHYLNREPFDPDLDYAQKIGSELKRFLSQKNSESQTLALSESFFSRVRQAINSGAPGLDENMAFYLMMHTPIEEVYSEFTGMSDEQLSAKAADTKKTLERIPSEVLR